MPDESNIKAQVRKGVLEYFVLLLLSNGKAYSSDILKNLTEARMIVVEGTLYTLLNRLRREGKLDYEWQESTQGPPRKYYFITEKGAQVRDMMGLSLDEIYNAINHIRNTQQIK